MTNSARFEIVRTLDTLSGHSHWHTRFRAANSRIVFTSETYTRRAGAENAILSIATALGIIKPVLVNSFEGDYLLLKSSLARGTMGVQVLMVDERNKP